MAVLSRTAPRVLLLDGFRASWRIGDFTECSTRASVAVREEQNECVLAAIERKREAQEAGAMAEAISRMDAIIRQLGKNWDCPVSLDG